MLIFFYSCDMSMKQHFLSMKQHLQRGAYSFEFNTDIITKKDLFGQQKAE